MLDFSLKQLEAFTAVAKYHSFTEAAELLYLSQSTVSTHISNLEASLGCRLFRRGAGNKPVLTEEGERIYREAEKILDRCESLYHMVEENACLKLGASTVPGKYLFPQLMSGFREQHPKSKYQLYNGNSGEIHGLLENGKVRIGLVGERLDDKKFTYEPIAEDRLVIITPNVDPYQSLQRENASGEKLIREPFLLREKDSGTRRFFESYLLGHGMAPGDLNIVAEMNDTETIKASVMQKMGVAVVSEFAVRDELRDKKLLAFDLESNGAYRKIYVAYQKKTVFSRLEDDFLHFVKQSRRK